MDPKDVYLKLDAINEHVSKVRENVAKTTAVLEENTRDIREHIRRTDLLEAKMLTMEQVLAQWKGGIYATTVAATIAAAGVQILVRYFFHA